MDHAVSGVSSLAEAFARVAQPRLASLPAYVKLHKNSADIFLSWQSFSSTPSAETTGERVSMTAGTKPGTLPLEP